MNNEKSRTLIKRYLQGTASSEEEALLEGWYLEAAEGQQDLPDEPDYAIIEDQILQSLRKAQRKPRVLWPRIAAAASIILCCSAAIYFYEHGKHPATANNLVQNDIKPGTNGAILTLANGKKIILESAKNGKLAQQNGSQVNKAGDSLLVYQPTAKTAAIAYNTLETPKGRQVEVVLPDGSKVWLNAASSLKYPTAFAGKERLVELTGEADFKVAANAKMPFRVKTEGQITEDIGTEFNINAYADEPSQSTTLLEGAIKVNSTLLKPGQQAVLTGGKLALTMANTAEVMAWKNGLFSFKDADLQTVMRQISRWYDVNIVYEGNISKRLFNGEIHRNANASKVLDILGYYNVHFRIDGKKIIVSN